MAQQSEKIDTYSVVYTCITIQLREIKAACLNLLIKRHITNQIAVCELKSAGSFILF